MQIFHNKIGLHIVSSFYILAAILLLAFPVKLVIAWFVASIIHELGHILALFLFRIRIYSIRIHAFGAVLETSSMNRKQEIICALAGPTAGLFLLFFCRKIPLIALCGVIQSVVNLVPIGQRDGGRALSCCLTGVLGEKKGRIAFSLIENVFRIILMFVFMLLLFYVQAWWILAVVIVLYIFQGKIPCKHRRQIVQ